MGVSLAAPFENPLHMILSFNFQMASRGTTSC
jgi:hypothetical protein